MVRQDKTENIETRMSIVKMEICTKYTNSSNTTESTSVEETFEWNSEGIARLIQINIQTYRLLIIVGTVGNGLTIYIMRRSSIKTLSTCFYMFVLALADSSK